MTTLVLADDHPIFLRGLRSVLAGEQTLQIIGEAANGEEALQLIRQLKPDLAILDVEMPKMTGFEVASILASEAADVSILFLTMYRDEAMFNKAIDIGVKGYVLKENAVIDIISAVETVRNGRYFISPLISDFLIRRGLPVFNKTEKQPPKNPVEKIGLLTPTELRILRLIGREKTSKEIASELHLSEKTVENHRGNVCKKFGITGSFVLNKWVLQNRDLVEGTRT